MAFNVKYMRKTSSVIPLCARMWRKLRVKRIYTQKFTRFSYRDNKELSIQVNTVSRESGGVVSNYWVYRMSRVRDSNNKHHVPTSWGTRGNSKKSFPKTFMKIRATCSYRATGYENGVMKGMAEATPRIKWEMRNENSRVTAKWFELFVAGEQWREKKQSKRKKIELA